MGLGCHLLISAVVVTQIAACTWGTFDGRNAASTQSPPVDPALGQNALSIYEGVHAEIGKRLVISM